MAVCGCLSVYVGLLVSVCRFVGLVVSGGLWWWFVSCCVSVCVWSVCMCVVLSVVLSLVVFSGVGGLWVWSGVLCGSLGLWWVSGLCVVWSGKVSRCRQVVKTHEKEVPLNDTSSFCIPTL